MSAEHKPHSREREDELREEFWAVAGDDLGSLATTNVARALTGLVRLTARLEEQLETLTARNQFLSTEQVRADVLQGQLEALRPYVQHRSTCILNVSQSVLRKSEWCDCGLREVAAVAYPASEPEETPLQRLRREDPEAWAGGVGYPDP